MDFELSVRRGLVYLTRPVAFGASLYMIWGITIQLPYFLYGLHIASLGEGASTVSILFTFWFYLPALQLAFYLAVGIQAVQTARRYGRAIQGRIIPPYDRKPPARDLPERWGYRRSRKQRMWKLAFGLSVASILLTNLVYLSSLQWHSEQVAEIVSAIPSDFLVTIFSSLLLAPIQQFGLSSGGEMNAATLTGSIFRIWLPAVPLTVWYLNLNSYLYEGMREVLFYFALYVSDAVTKVSTRF